MLQCAPGTVELLTLQPEGRRRMQADEFLRGHQQKAPMAIA
jgi:methionyl-tRNA formyltransferase